MATVKAAYDTSTSITITATTLAAAASRESAAIDNSSNLYLDAILQVIVTLAAGSPADFKCVNILVAGSEDGTNWGDNATGADAAITLRVPTNLYQLGTIQTPDSGALTYKSAPMSVARAFGGKLPRKWSLIISNHTNIAFTACTAKYTGVTATVA